MPDIAFDTSSFISENDGVLMFSDCMHTLYKASLSNTTVSSTFSNNWFTASVVLYGSVTVSDTFADGNTEYVITMRSG